MAMGFTSSSLAGAAQTATSRPRKTPKMYWIHWIYRRNSEYQYYILRLIRKYSSDWNLPLSFLTLWMGFCGRKRDEVVSVGDATAGLVAGLLLYIRNETAAAVAAMGCASLSGGISALVRVFPFISAFFFLFLLPSPPAGPRTSSPFLFTLKSTRENASSSKGRAWDTCSASEGNASGPTDTEPKMASGF